MNKQIVVNYGIEYNAVFQLLKWFGVEGTPLFTSFNKVIDDLDGFLFESLTKDHSILFIGFFPENQEEIKQVYNNFPNMKFLYEENEGELLRKLMVNRQEELRKFDKDKLNFLKLVLGWSIGKSSDYSYFLNILYRKLSTDFYNDFVENGVKDFSAYRDLIKEHVIEFKKTDSKLYSLKLKDGELYFVNSFIEYLDDCLFKFINKTGNLCLVDSNRKRVYFRKLPNNPIDILQLCTKLTTGGGGHQFAGSGNITKPFLEITKNIKLVKDD